jgi:predicted transcriptional regulator
MKQEILAPSLGIEHPTVKDVIKLANSILNEGRILNVDYLYRRAKRELKIPREGLLTIIQFLVNRKIIVDGSKYTRKTILNNQLRRCIFDFIQENIGLHFSAMKRELKKILKDHLKGTGHLTWHLEMLLKFNLIKNVEVINRSIFIPFDYSAKFAKICFLARHHVRNKILRYLIENKTSTKSEISDKIQESRENVYYHINVLIENDLIINHESDLFLNSDLRKDIINAINLLLDKKKLENKTLYYEVE